MVNKKADRARQFLPFDALKGYKAEIEKKKKVIINKKYLSEDDAKVLEYKLNQITVGMMIKVIYYFEDKYIALEGMVSKIEKENGILVIVKNKINIKDIINISGDNIKDYETY